MSNARATHLSRRGMLAAGGALGLGAVLAACGDDDAKSGGSGADASKAAAAPAGPWTFKDDRGQTAKADKVPSNIVAFTGVAAALHDYGVEVKGVFGPTTTKDGKADVQAGDLDVTKVTVLGNEWGQFNIEKYAALAPDLLVTTMFDSAGTLWYVPEESKEKILAVGAPTVGISVFDIQLDQPLQRMLELAKTLGADTASAKVTAAKKAFEDAAARLRAATKAKPNIKVLVGSASQDIFYVSGSNLSVDLEYFKALGVNFVEPSADALKASGGWYENLSWENVDKYGADIIMMDNRTSAIQPADITEATWKQLPAVKAGQVIARNPEPILSYDKCTPLLTSLAEAIESAKKVS
ncbi:ABC transporter substrate-binding protein [Streptomyces sp. WI04-05B]|uniref:ABC transporter substrate-binding protein n=1 Tax=Streptomyces TaxID=1883 RepID=UPI0029B48609|nr:MULTISPECIES: ABC transporter substrate-binding protein [unclassified Streptomyces]MDX2543841.1 ABC transporter substrate-binding protein [Streptomyces sp. WI04-05B]MDX2582069.1 ABC transporter substrate-binding protein [Streptomyces sp. WI04-05A]MDX3752481.1 ABC transporter substrate-binding protein [Streptomyces sp. AK08-02]